MTSPSQNPASLFTAVSAFFAVFSGTIVFTPKDAFLTRLSAVACLFAIQYPIYIILSDSFPTKAMEAAYMTGLWVAWASAGELVLISRASREDLTEGDERVGTITLLYRASCLYFNLRRAGTKWEIKDLGYIKPRSRLGFLAYKSCTIGLCLLVLDGMTSAPPPEPHLVSKDKQTLWDFGKLSSEDVVFRLIVVISMWVSGFLCNYLVINTGAFAAVALGLSKPEVCPRAHNGPFSSLTSVRSFWSTFWHQLLRRTLTGWSDAISDNVLGLRKGTLLSRYTRLFLAFFISGVIHQAMDAVWQTPHREAVSTVFFTLQALGIMTEDAVQALTKTWGIPQKVRSVFGFLWLCAFMWWTTPRWFYGTIRSPIESQPLPFSLFKQ